MTEHLREQIRRAFEDEYQAPSIDLRQMLRASERGQRPRVGMPVRLGAVVALMALVAVAIALPRFISLSPRPAAGSRFSQVLPDYGYVVIATAQNLSGKGGRQELGVLPAGRAYGVDIQTYCTGPTLHTTTYVAAKEAAWRHLIVGVFSSDGHIQEGQTARTSLVRDCSALVGHSSRSGSMGTTSPGSPRPEPLFVVAARGIAWRVTLEAYRTLGGPPQLPTTLGTCRSQGVGWSWSPGSSSASGSEISLQPTFDPTTPKCRLTVPVKLGLFFGGTTTPVKVSGNLHVATLAGSGGGNPPFPRLRWRWSNWCGPRRPVQLVFFGPNGAVIVDTTTPVPTPACVSPSLPSTLILESAP